MLIVMMMHIQTDTGRRRLQPQEVQHKFRKPTAKKEIGSPVEEEQIDSEPVKGKDKTCAKHLLGGEGWSSKIILGVRWNYVLKLTSHIDQYHRASKEAHCW